VPQTGLAGRREALDRLHDGLRRVREGTRQTVFLSGAAGTGKTALVSAFLSEIPSETGIAVARGECLELSQAVEPFLPLLEAFGRLCRDANGRRFVPLFERYAPTWLAQMPSVLQTAEPGAAAPSRMLRESIEAVEALSAESCLLIVLEDLQWSDPATLDFIAAMTRPGSLSQLLLICSHRPGAGGRLERIVQQAAEHRTCIELKLDAFNCREVAGYLDRRFAPHAFPVALADTLQHMTEGNPRQVADLVEEWIQHGVLAMAEGVWRLTTPLAQFHVMPRIEMETAVAEVRAAAIGAPAFRAPEIRLAPAGPVLIPPRPIEETGWKPETHYTRSGDVNIAYQVVGEGPFDLVFVMGGYHMLSISGGIRPSRRS